MEGLAQTPKAEKREIKSLTSLRGIAALAVVATHFSATAQNLATQTIPSLVPHGYVAVDFFFVLSGFIMSYTYLDSFESGRPGATRDFLARRVARILPLHMAMILVITAAALLSIELLGRNIFFNSTHFWRDFVLNLLLLPGLGFGPNFNGPSWSISTESAAYLAFPLFVAAMFSRHRIVWGAAIALSVAALMLLASMRPRLGLNIETSPLSLVRCFAEFVLGMAAFRLYRNAAAMRILATDACTIGLAAACGLSLVARYDLPAALLFPFLVAAAAGNRGFAARVLEHSVFYFLGLVSYSIYLIHNPLRPLELMAAQALWPDPVSTPVALGLAALGTLSVIPFAWLAYTAIERPGRNFVRRLFAGTLPGLRRRSVPAPAYRGPSEP